MKKHYLVVTIPQNSIRVTSIVSNENQERLTELLTGKEHVMATFDVHDLTVLLKTKSGSMIILKAKSPT